MLCHVCLFLSISIYLQGIVSVSGEDETSVNAYIKQLKQQYSKAQPDTVIVNNAMIKTFAWRRKEVADGVPTEELANKYPFLKTPTGVCTIFCRCYTNYQSHVEFISINMHV